MKLAITAFGTIRDIGGRALPSPEASTTAYDFGFLGAYDPKLAAEASRAQGYVTTDPAAALVKAGVVAETMARRLRDQLKLGRLDREQQSELVARLHAGGHIPDRIRNLFEQIGRKRNAAAHAGEGSTTDARFTVARLYSLAQWFHEANGAVAPKPKPALAPVPETPVQPARTITPAPTIAPAQIRPARPVPLRKPARPKAGAVLFKALAVVLLLCALVVAAGYFLGKVSGSDKAIAKPSFDCAMAKRWDERQICANSALAQADQAMAGLYAQRMHDAADRSAKHALRTDQRAWLRTRLACQSAGDPASCLSTAFESRIAQLKSYTGPAASSAPTTSSAASQAAAETARPASAVVPARTRPEAAAVADNESSPAPADAADRTNDTEVAEAAADDAAEPSTAAQDVPRPAVYAPPQGQYRRRFAAAVPVWGPRPVYAPPPPTFRTGPPAFYRPMGQGGRRFEPRPYGVPRRAGRERSGPFTR